MNLVLIALSVALSLDASDTAWPQWGGPNRDFRSPATGLLKEWPAEGPKTIWKHELGEGYSAIVAAGDTIYTMYRSGDDEHVVALDAATGAQRWKHTYAAPLPSDADTSFGRGPNATPLLTGDRLVTVGFTGKLLCLSAKDGKVLWSADLLKDYNATALKFGYSSSPLLHKDAVILPIGSKDVGLAALALADGAVRWKSPPFDNSYSSPILIDAGTNKEVTLATAKKIVAVQADNGKPAWSHDFENQWDTHCTTPVDCGKGRVFYPTFEGGVLLQIERKGDAPAAKEVWKTTRIGAGQTNVVCVDETLFGASGSGRSGFFACVKLDDGKAAWRERVPLATVVYADGRLFILDEAGGLRVAKAAADKFDQIGQAALLEAKAWTVPTLAGGRLFLRDQKNILALDLAGRSQ